MVEDLIDLEAIVYGYFNGMRSPESIECKGLLNGISLHASQ
jgi:hypothetical protein